MKVLIKSGQLSTLLTLPDGETPVENLEVQLAVNLEEMTVSIIVDVDGTTYTASAELEE